MLIRQQGREAEVAGAFETKWKSIKVDYEVATNKKKPSDKFLGLFKKPSGLEPHCKALDKALDDLDLVEAKKAAGKLEKAADDYQKLLFKAAGAEKDKEVAADTKRMMVALAKLTDEAMKSKVTLPYPKSLGEFDKLMKSAAGERIKDYAKKCHRPESMLFLQAMLKKDYSAKTFATFLKDNDINISAGLLKKVDETKLKEAPWVEITDEVRVLFNTNIIKDLNSGKG